MQFLQPNTTLQGGKYKIEHVLGQGGFGITYLAMQTSLQRKVAIKEFFMKDFCSRDDATSTMMGSSTGSNKLVEQYKKKFVKEARNLAKLSHPNIINVIDVFEENDTVYYAMPYLSGGSLQDYVKSRGALSETEAMKYVRQIAKALKYMHEEQHMCHYDVKPANILLDDKGNAVLIDFGISKGYDEGGHETSTTPIGLSEGYAPIEQYQQGLEEFSPTSDVYALGATLYFLLHGKKPASAIDRVSGKSLNVNSSLSESIRGIIDTSMKVSKTERARNVNVFLNGVSSPTPPRKTEPVPQEKSYGWFIYLVIGLIGLGIAIYVNNHSNTDYSDSVELTDGGAVESGKTDVENASIKKDGPISVLSQHYSGTSFFKADSSRPLYAEQSWDITWPTSGNNCDVTSLQRYLLRTIFETNNFSSYVNNLQSVFSLLNDEDKWIKVNRKGESNTGLEELLPNDTFPLDEPFYRVSLKELDLDSNGKVTYCFIENVYLGSGTGASYSYTESYFTYDIKNGRVITFGDVFRNGAERTIVNLLKTRSINVDDYNCVDVSSIENIHKDKFYIDYSHEIAYFIFDKYEISCGADGEVKLGLKLSDLNNVLR